MSNKPIFAFIFLLVASTSLAQIALPLTKYYFSQPNSSTTDPNDAFLTDPGSIAIDTVDNAYYNVLVQIGSTQEPFSLVIDTASSFDFVTADSVPTGSHHFDCNSSSSCSLSNLLFPIWYEDGSEVQGSLIDETVYLPNNVQVTQRLVLVTNNNISFLQFPGDGQLGLEQRPQALGISVGMHTFIENLQSQGKIPNKSFGIFLANSTSDNSSSELMLGGFNTNYMMSQDLIYYPLSTNDAWKIDLSSFAMGSNNFSTSSSLTFDTRCSAIVAKKSDFANLLQMAQGIDSTCATQTYGEETFIRCTCSNGADDYQKFPDIGLVFSGNDQQYFIYANQYVFHDTDGNCVLGIAQAGTLDDSWAVGHSFMKNYYTYYDQDNNQIGIVQSKQ